MFCAIRARVAADWWEFNPLFGLFRTDRKGREIVLFRTTSIGELDLTHQAVLAPSGPMERLKHERKADVQCSSNQ
jgi:hypothetical protein